MFLIHQYLIPFHDISCTFHTILIWFSIINHYLIHFWVYQSVFDTLLSVSWVYQNCIKSESKQGVQFWSAQKCIKVQPEGSSVGIIASAENFYNYVKSEIHSFFIGLCSLIWHHFKMRCLLSGSQMCFVTMVTRENDRMLLFFSIFTQLLDVILDFQNTNVTIRVDSF